MVGGLAPWWMGQTERTSFLMQGAPPPASASCRRPPNSTVMTLWRIPVAPILSMSAGSGRRSPTFTKVRSFNCPPGGSSPPIPRWCSAGAGMGPTGCSRPRSGSEAVSGDQGSRLQGNSSMAPRRSRKRGWSGFSRLHHQRPSV